ELDLDRDRRHRWQPQHGLEPGVVAERLADELLGRRERGRQDNVVCRDLLSSAHDSRHTLPVGQEPGNLGVRPHISPVAANRRRNTTTSARIITLPPRYADCPAHGRVYSLSDPTRSLLAGPLRTFPSASKREP